jgi:hypothetical protein
MSLNDETRKAIRDIKYRTQELDAKTSYDKIEDSELKARVEVIYGLAEKLKKNWE